MQPMNIVRGDTDGDIAMLFGCVVCIMAVMGWQMVSFAATKHIAIQVFTAAFQHSACHADLQTILDESVQC